MHPDHKFLHELQEILTRVQKEYDLSISKLISLILDHTSIPQQEILFTVICCFSFQQIQRWQIKNGGLKLLQEMK